jgi:hypothetical protein
MKDEYIIINSTALQKRIEELEGDYDNGTLTELKRLLSQSTPLIPELQKTWNAAYIDAMSIDEETYEPLFFQDYITNLKLDI